jgi:TRAP-type C4-dicarboxylate transport system substrate-binding protein
MKRAFFAAAAAMLVCGPAMAQQTVKLTIMSGNAPAFSPIGAAIEAYIPAVDKALAASGTKVNWVQGWGGQIVKPREELQGVQTGLGDIGVVPGAFYGDKLTLIQIGYNTPFTSSDVDVTTEGMAKMLAAFPELGKQAERFNQIYLGLAGVADDYSLWSKKEIKKYEDLKGMKIGAVGANQPWVASAGASPVLVELATSYNALQTGVFEAIVLWQQAMASFKFCELAPYQLDAHFGAVSNVGLTMNRDSWNKQPAAVQAALKGAAKDWAADNDKKLKAGAQAGKALCEGSYKQKTNALSPAEMKTWANALPPMGKTWAKQQDDAGMPGTKILAAWMDFMREKKQTVLRDWDKN